ncbi:hypothetical protein [Dysgonomonas sp. 511]|uniref:hypothetical protein n=1 Tax=Dysgonomonas sp. 511 TaxID=2302930 RepID=UPI0013D4DAB7|nr:hypothetical protein [Dysgonomonas sp. 511]NDV80317.1 hypothetical protein [Dysgonomonas sp. 511]
MIVAIIIIAIISPISIFIGKIMKSDIPAKKNAITGCIAFLVTAIVAFLGNMAYYKYFVTKRELYQYSDTLMGRILITTVLLAIIGWIAAIYMTNKKKN